MSNKMKNARAWLLFLWVAVISLSVSAQNVTVKGTVTDKTGETVIGASVVQKGNTGNGTITDLDGNFTISVPSNATLVISFVGYKTQEVAVKGQKLVNVVMEDDSQALEEVVVIGYGTTKKKDLTGSVVSVGGETLAKVPVASAAEALTGRLAGVQITTTDGSPEAEMLIRVRGGGSVTGDNSPLYIVDGFPVSNINDVAPADIATIDVLKDASSTAIYGSQGANGVVIITTKSAKGGKTQISYNGYVQSKKLAKRKEVLNNYEYALANYELAALEGSNGLKNFEKKFGVFDDLYLYNSVEAIDWQDDMFGSNVLSQSHNVSIQGGNDKTKYSLSVTYQKDGGLMVNNDYSRLTGNFKLSHEISKVLKFDFNARLSDATTNGSGTSGGNYKVRTSQAVTSRPIKGLEGFTEIDPSQLTDEEYEQYIRDNMTLTEQQQQYWKKKFQKSYKFNGGINWDILKGLRFRVEAGYEWAFNETQSWWGHTTSNASYVGGLPLADWTKANARKLREAATLTYDFDLNKDHKFNVMLGQEINSTMGDENYMKADHFSKDLSAEKVFANFGLADGTLTTTSKVNPDQNLASFFGRLNYNFRDRYLVTFTMRADGSSKFAPGNQWGYFPAGAIAWRVNEEPFMENTQDWLSNLKLRLSYGTVGNNRIADMLYMPTYAINVNKAYGIGDKINNYYATASKLLANPNLKWETTITRNIGLDFGLFDEKISGTVEAYWNSAVDLLIERNIIAPGYEKTMENTAETSNKGIELSLNAFILENKNYSLSANFNIGFNKSNVEKLADGLKQMEFASGWAGTDLKGYNDFRVEVGQPLGLMVGWVTDGYYTTNDFTGYDESTGKYTLKQGVPTVGMLGGRAGVRPGTIKFKDISGPNGVPDGVVDDYDRTVIGKATPKVTGGFGLNGTFHGFDASLMFNFVLGNDIYNAEKIASTQQYRTSNPNLLNIMNSSNRYTYIDNAGNLVTDLATLAAMNEGANAKKYWTPWSFGNATAVPHSWAVENGSFLRLQNVTVGYTIPAKYTKKFLCEQFRVYCTLNNVFVLTDYSGYDPEVSSSIRGSKASGLTPGVDYSAYPKSFSWTLGVNLTF